MTIFNSFKGIITMIDEFYIGTPKEEGCYKLMTIQNNDSNIVNFVISPHTFFVDYFMMNIGDLVEGFYDANAPVPLIYPPQYRALVVALLDPIISIKVDYFNEYLLSSDGSLRLNISPDTEVTQENGQLFTGNLSNHNLIVMYNFTTRSIPAQTFPERIIVLCR